MAAKRLHEQSDSDPDEQESKRIETAPSCISTLIRSTAMIRSLESLGALLEPMMRRAVREETEDVILRLANKFSRSSSLRIGSTDQTASTLRLIFPKSLFLPIFTNSKIVDLNRSPLQVQLINTNGNGQIPLSPFKLEIFALDGDFAAHDCSDWTSEEFDAHILKARENRPPLLTGDVIVTLRNGKAEIGELALTDNSSWVRSRHFRIGARVCEGSFPERIKEAITGPFQVRDNRGQAYMKHFPPSLKDEVWRLKNISKDGVFHNKLNDERIKNVEEFVKQLHLNEPYLKKILAMPEKQWDATVKHALTCKFGSNRYIYHAHALNSTIMLSSTCQVLAAYVDGQFYNQNAITGQIKTYVQEMTRSAILQWDQLQVVDELVDPTILITNRNHHVDQTNMASSSKIANSSQEQLYMNNIGSEFSIQAANQPHQMGVSEYETFDHDNESYDMDFPPPFNYEKNI